MLGVLGSALRTVVVPRDEQSLITRWCSWGSGACSTCASGGSTRGRPSTGGWPATPRWPSSCLPAAWITVVLLALTPMFWALGAGFPRDSFTRSGSSLLTLGFAFANDLPATVLSFAAATIGLGLVALLISYLPSIYAQFSRREVLVGQMDTRAGTPPDPVVLLTRAHAIGLLPELDQLWRDWERWFVEVDESHTSNVALAFFRSQHPQRSWLTAAGCVLDAAALRFVVPRSSPLVRGPALPAVGVPHAAPSVGPVRDPLRPRPLSPRSGSRSSARSSRAPSTGSSTPGFRWSPTGTRPGADYSGWRVNYDEPLLGPLRADRRPASSLEQRPRLDPDVPPPARAPCLSRYPSARARAVRDVSRGGRRSTRRRCRAPRPSRPCRRRRSSRRPCRRTTRGRAPWRCGPRRSGRRRRGTPGASPGS